MIMGTAEEYRELAIELLWLLGDEVYSAVIFGQREIVGPVFDHAHVVDELISRAPSRRTKLAPSGDK